MLAFFINFRDPYFYIAFAGLYNVLGNYLPIKAQDQRHWNKVQNANKYLLGPLIVSCLSTPLILCIIWRNYDQIVL